MNFVQKISTHRWDLTPSREVLEHACLPGRLPLSVTSVEFHDFSIKMSFNVADAHCDVKIYDYLGSASSGRHVLCGTGVGSLVHDTLAKRDSTPRTEKAALRRVKVALSLRAFDFPLVLQ